MHIVHISAELAPLAKVGGLGDVLLGLCRELSWKGHDVDMVIPKYDCMDTSQVRDLNIIATDVECFYDGKSYKNTIWMGWVENLRVYFVDPHHPSHFFERGCFYGCEDDIDRYLYFSRAALEFLSSKQIKPDILHLHDWHTAAVALLQQEIFKDKGLNKAKTVFTIHNLEYQGKCAPFNLDRVGLDSKKYLIPSELQDHDPALINLLKGALKYSDYITTVSPNYAKEVLTPEGGRGLDRVLSQYKNKFCGVLNGIDYSYWNPEIDRYLPAHYSSRELPINKKDRNTLDKKAFIKKTFRDQQLLAGDHSPIIGCVTRLVPQKGLEMIKHALTYTLAMGGQFVLLGSSPVSSISDEFHALKKKYADNPHVCLILHHQEELAHMVYAASDMFIVPSLFEPCGLTQLIALKYGAIPIVRRTGGLADTIFDVDHAKVAEAEKNGYTFDTPDASGIESAMVRAIGCWFHQPDRWRKMMIHAMNIDYSWNEPSNRYLEIYKSLL